MIIDEQDIMRIIDSSQYQINDAVKQRIKKDNLEYEPLNQTEFNKYILDFLHVLNDDLVVAGRDRQVAWHSGWNENLQEYIVTRDLDSLIPKYHNKNILAKLHGQIIRTETQWFDYKLHSYVVDTILGKHLNTASPAKVVEIGCGTGYHLFRQQDQFPQHKYFGLDFARSSQEIIKETNRPGVTGAYFNYFNPTRNVRLTDAIVYSVASLEQIGEDYHKFIQHIIAQRPKMVIHFEPIKEVFDTENNLLDYLHHKYMTKRKYLHGYLTTLQSLEKLGVIKIYDTRRLHYGSKFIEGHTLIQWSPI